MTSRLAHIPARVTLAALACLAAGELPAQQRAAAPRELRIAVVASPADSARAAALARGVALGAEEAARSAALFGWRVTVRTVRDIAELPAGGDAPAALLGGTTLAECRAVAAEAERRAVPYLNAACADDVLRGTERGAWSFHVAPAEAMRRDAGAGAVAWDSTLERFGAAQLNDRFRARFGRGMGELEWGGWLAVKMLTESALRARSAAPAALRRQLESAPFDGHKGARLTFRAADRQLAQPLYLPDGARGPR